MSAPKKRIIAPSDVLCMLAIGGFITTGVCCAQSAWWSAIMLSSLSGCVLAISYALFKHE